MKKFFLIGIVFVLAGFYVSAQQMDDDDDEPQIWEWWRQQEEESRLPRINIVNATGYDFLQVFAKPSRENSWDNAVELLGGLRLSTGQLRVIELSRSLAAVDEYDFAAVDVDNDVYLKLRVSIRNSQNIAFAFNEINYEFYGVFLAPMLAARARQGPQITIVNDTISELAYVFAKPSSETTWQNAVEVLNGSIRSSENKTVRLHLPLSAATVYDFVAVDINGRFYTKMRVTIGNNTRLVFGVRDENRNFRDPSINALIGR